MPASPRSKVKDNFPPVWKKACYDVRPAPAGLIYLRALFVKFAPSDEVRSSSIFGGSLPRILDVGCGPTKYPGSVGLDMNPATAADVICNLDRGGLPFRDNSFDQLRAEHIIEHVDNIIATMEEFHRVTRPGGTIFLATPHYTDYSSFRDPTHRWHLNTYSFLYFYPGGMHGRDMWYTKVRMREVKLNLTLLKLWRVFGFQFLVNHSRMFRQFWEHYLSFVIRGKLMEFTFEVIK
jgi:SAM-dependent methyltransferase